MTAVRCPYCNRLSDGQDCSGCGAPAPSLRPAYEPFGPASGWPLPGSYDFEEGHEEGHDFEDDPNEPLWHWTLRLIGAVTKLVCVSLWAAWVLAGRALVLIMPWLLIAMGLSLLGVIPSDWMLWLAAAIAWLWEVLCAILSWFNDWAGALKDWVNSP